MEIPLHSKVLQNVEETALRNENAAALENAYVNDAGGITRFPCLKEFCDIAGDARVMLEAYDNDLIAVSNGRTFRIDESGDAVEVTSAYVTGGGRVSFAITDRDLIMAAGGDIVRYRGEKAELLSRTAPKAYKVCYKDGYLIGIEPSSNRFFHTSVGVYEEFDPMDTFSAEGSTDNITAAVVSPYGELILAGEKSVEMFDTSPDGNKPFYRRYITPNGIIAPDAFFADDTTIWGVDNKKQFSSFNSQVSTPKSDHIQASLSSITDFTDAWASDLVLGGQTFIILQIPNAVTPYGSQGVTLLYDPRKHRWASLYGWDEVNGIPARWPVWCIKQCFGRVFAGGNGKIYELTTNSEDVIHVQRSLWRSGIIRNTGFLNSLKIHIERGYTPHTKTVPQLSLRVNKDNRGWGKWVRRSLNKMGHRHMILNYASFGHAETWQFEIEITDVGKLEMSLLNAEFI